MIYKKIKKLTTKVFNSKTYLLMAVNRYVPEAFGKITDLSVDKDEKNIYIQMQKDEKTAHLGILKYAVTYKGSQAYLSFEKIEKDSYLESTLKNVDIKNNIKIDPLYLKIVKSML